MAAPEWAKLLMLIWGGVVSQCLCNVLIPDAKEETEHFIHLGEVARC